MRRPPALVFGIAVADTTEDEFIDHLDELIDEGRRLGRRHQVATVNVDFVVNALDDPSIKSILQHADLCLADGMPIVWTAGWLGMPIADRVTGADLVPRLMAESAGRGWKVHVFGSAPEVAEQATRIVIDRYPTAHFTIDPGPMIADITKVDDAVIDSIRQIDADIVCVALGNPKQERFIELYGERIGAPVMIGVGGSLDMLVGKRKRAPEWSHRVGLEWVFRAAQEPRRLGLRYAHDIRVFGPRLASELSSARRRSRGAGCSIETTVDGVRLTVGGGRADRSRWDDASRAALDGADVHLVGGDHPVIRDDAAATIVGLVACARRGGGHVEWQQPGAALEALQKLGLAAHQFGG